MIPRKPFTRSCRPRRVLPVIGTMLTAACIAVAQDDAPVRKAEPVDDAPVKKAEPVTDETPETPKPAPPKPKPAEAEPAPAPATPRTVKKAASGPEQNLFEYANLCYTRKAWDLAVQQYSEYLATYGKGEFAQVASYRLAESLLNLGRNDDAEAAYRQLIERFKTGDYVANSAYRIASLHYNRSNFDQAVPYFETAAAQSKQEKIRHSALYYKARSLTESNQPKAAYTEYERLAKVQENNAFWERAMVQLARSDEAADRAENALTRWSKLSLEALDPEVKAEALVKAARLLKDGGKNADAVAAFQKAIQLKDEKSAAWRAIARFGLVESHHKAGEWEKVIQSYQSTESVQLPEDQRPRLWLLVGDAYSKLKQFRRAIDLFLMIDQYYPESPENAEAGFRRLLCLNELKDPTLPTLAGDVIAKIRRISPDSDQIDRAQFITAEYYFVRQDYAEALRGYKAVRPDKLPENIRDELLFRRGWAAVEAGDHATAIAAFSGFMEASPDDPQVPQALAKRGMAYKASADWKNAQADFDRIITSYADSPVAELAYEQSALTKGQRKDVEGMIVTFQQLLEKFPQSRAAAEAWFWIGSGHFDLKKYLEAIPSLEKARQLDPKNYEKDASLRIVLSYYYLNDLKNLVKAVEAERTKEDPGSRVPRQVYQFLGLKHFELGEMSAADKYLTFSATPDRPEDTDFRVWFNLSEARIANERWDAALVAADNYLKKDDLPPAQKAKGMLNKARALYELQRWDEAAPVCNEAIRLQPEARVGANLRLLLGDIFMAQGEYEHASQIYVVPAQMFDDAEITPLALWKTVQASEKAGKAGDAADMKKDLEKRFPKFRPPVAKEPAPAVKKATPAAGEG